MYIITNQNNKIVDISTLTQYVKRLNNGTVIYCPEEESNHIYSNGSNSFFLRKSEEMGVDCHELHEVEEIPVGVVADYYYFNKNDGSFYSTEEDLSKLYQKQLSDSLPSITIELAEQTEVQGMAILELADMIMLGGVV